MTIINKHMCECTISTYYIIITTVSHNGSIKKKQSILRDLTCEATMRTQKFRFISACRDNLLFFPSFGITQRPDKQPSLVKTSLPDVRTLIKRRFRSVINSLAYRPTTIRARRSRENTQRCQRQIRVF